MLPNLNCITKFIIIIIIKLIIILLHKKISLKHLKIFRSIDY